MKKQFTYDPKVLVEMAQGYLEAERDYREFINTHKDEYGTLQLLSTEENVNYWVKEKECYGFWSALCSACRLVNADILTVVATGKAMNRYEKRNKWQVCAYLPTGLCSACYWDYGEDRVTRFFAAQDPDKECYQSTGRRKGGASMKLTKEDKKLLLSLGCAERDLGQIDEAVRKTTYKYRNRRIDWEEAIELLGRENFFRGILRSAFHWSAIRHTSRGEPVYFDSSRLFEE